MAKSLPNDAGSAAMRQRRPPPPPPAAAPAAVTELRNFHTQAAGISRDIANTSALLTELTHAVRHKSLFQDDSANVNALVVRIKSAIENLNARLETADRTIQQQKRVLGKNSQVGQEAANLVSELQSEFAEAASDFKKVLQQRTETLKETEDMQRQVYSDMDDIPDMSRLAEPPSLLFGHNGTSGSGGFPALDLTSSLMAAGEPTGSGGGGGALPRPHGIAGSLMDANKSNGVGTPNSSALGSYQSQRPTYSGQYSNYSSGNSAAPLTPLDIQRMEMEQGDSQMLQLIPDQSYLQTRADAMSTVESNIVELGTIFNKLAGLVHEHREMVQRVEDNVEEANTNIFLSMNVLTDTLTNLRSNRALAMRLSGILVLFIIFFIVFFA
jgi:syntaxin 5